MDIRENVSLAPLTTFKIGGHAHYFVRARTVEDVREAIAFANGKKLKVFILGGGSNVLFDDAGFDGLVVQVAIEGVEREGNTIIAGAGENWDGFVAHAIADELWGIENLSGIPGTVGGAVVQNIGAYGAALSQTFAWAEVLDVQSGEVKRISKGEYASGYRESIFKHQDGRYVILRAALQLSDEPAPNVSYKDLAQRFADTSLDLPGIRKAVLEIRANKFPDLSVEGTAGSFFKNPVLPQAQAQELAKRYPGMPVFALPESSDIKIPLGWFLDWRHDVIDLRETHVGGARMYEKQFLVAVAQRGTSSKDVQMLAHIVQEKVREKIGIEIEPEVRVVPSGME